MRILLLCSLLIGSSIICSAQVDTTGFKRSRQDESRRPEPEVLIPGVNSPTSSPGTLMQSSPDPNVLPADQRKKRRTSPPSDPRAFGLSIPLEKRAKKDTLKNN